VLQHRGNETPTQDNIQKVQILTEKFFPATEDTDLSDIIADSPKPSWLGITHVVIKQELLRVVKQLPTGQALGPDGILNEILKLIILLLWRGTLCIALPFSFLLYYYACVAVVIRLATELDM
jgi:hypothetical protein